VNLLLDTCSLLWALQDANRLSAPARRALKNPDHTVSVSVVSFWEIGLKCGLGKLSLQGAEPEDIPRFVADAGWQIIPLSPGVAASAGRLPRPTDHRDPFDRLLIWTAIHEGFSLVSGDDDFPAYVPHGLKICW
jgi:PIN domain nuclease of toxin-antitoxin system